MNSLLSSLFRSFLPSHNALGWGAVDWLEFLLALLLVLAVLVPRTRVMHWLRRLGYRTWLAMAVFAVLPILLRAMLLAHYPVPFPNVADEWSHLLVGDTLLHLRLANPSHPFARFFETFFVLQEPSYCSIYPLGQGISLAIGHVLFGTPWGGVVLATGTFCALAFWMLRAWTSRSWALVGAAVTVMQFGPLSQWMNSYWGGAFAACGGCLVFGALPRLQRDWCPRNAFLLSLGLAVLLLTRPYESLFVLISVTVFLFVWCRHNRQLRSWLALASMLLLSGLLMLVQNRQATGTWTTIPYALSQFQYGVPVSLTFQSNPTPHHALTPEQQSEYEIQRNFKAGRETPARYFARLDNHLGDLWFYVFPGFAIALLAGLFRLREPMFAWAFATLLLSIAGTNFFPAFHFHYLAPVTCLFTLWVVLGLEHLAQLRIRSISVGRPAAWLLVALCGSFFLFWFGVHLVASADSSRLLTRFESWDALNNPRPLRRLAVDRQLKQTKEKKLVFVHYYPQHPSSDEWVWNRADIDKSETVWARDRGPEENRKLKNYFNDRSVWLLEPDFRPNPKLTRYSP